MYDLQGDYQQYSLGSDAAELGVIDARIHENGLVALTGSLLLLEVKGWEGAKPLTLANPGKLSFPALVDPLLITTRRINSATSFMGSHTSGPHYFTARGSVAFC